MGKGVFRVRLHYPAGNVLQTPMIGINNPIAGYPTPRINPQYSFHQPGFLTSWKGLVFCRTACKIFMGNTGSSGNLFHQVIINIKIGMYILNVLMIFQIFQKFH